MPERFYELNNTAEQIDKALTDITDIMEDEVYDAPVVLKKGENGNRDYLSTDSALIKDYSIIATENSFLIGDGENWAKEGNFKEIKIDYEESKDNMDEYFVSGPRRTEIFNQDGIGMTEIPSSFRFGGGGRIREEEVEREVPIPGSDETETITETKKFFTSDCYLKISDFATTVFEDNSKVKIKGNADIEIGKEGHSFTLFQYNLDESTHFTLSSPFTRIEDAAYIVVDASIEQAAPPIIIVHGGAYIDISDGQTDNDLSINQRFCRPRTPGDYSYYTDANTNINQYPKCPWTETGSWYNQKGSIFLLHENPTFMMEDAPVFYMKDHSVMGLDGCARFYMKAGDSRKTNFLMDSGSHFVMEGEQDGDYEICVKADVNSFYFGKQLGVNPENFNAEGKNDWIISWSNDSRQHMNLVNSPGTFGASNNFFKYSPPAEKRTVSMRGIQFLTEARSDSMTQLQYNSESGGETYVNRQAHSGVLLDRMLVDGGTIDTSYVIGTNSYYVKDVSFRDNAVVGIKIGPDRDANFSLNVTPSGISSINFDPSGKFYFSCNSSSWYQSVLHPSTYFEYVDGDVFKQINGYGHSEIQDGSASIMRRDQLQWETRVFSLKGKKFEEENGFSFSTKNDYTGLTVEDLKNNPNDYNSLQQAFLLYGIDDSEPNFHITKKDYHNEHVKGGQIVSSTPNYQQKYTTSMNMTKITIPKHTSTGQFWVKAVSPVSDYQVRADFLAKCKEIFGQSATMSNYSTFSYQITGSGNNMRARATSSIYVENINYTGSMYTNEKYNANDSYNSFSAEDKTLVENYPFHLYASSIGNFYFGPYGSSQTSTVTVVSSEIRPDMSYTTKINNFVYITITGHARHKWSCPVQNRRKDDTSGPITQFYDRSNLLMRGWLNDSSSTYESSVEKTAYPSLFIEEDFVITDKNEVNNLINYLISNDENFATNYERMDYQYYISKITIKNHDTIYQDVSSRSVDVILNYRTWDVGEEIHVERKEDAPTVEFNDAAYLFMNGKSELKLEDDTLIVAKKNNGIIEYTFGDENDINNQITFTIDELKALKQLLT